MLGGRENSRPQAMDKVHILNIRDWRWTTYEANSVDGHRVPKNRYGHSATYLASRSQVSPCFNVRVTRQLHIDIASGICWAWRAQAVFQ